MVLHRDTIHLSAPLPTVLRLPHWRIGKVQHRPRSRRETSPTGEPTHSWISHRTPAGHRNAPPGETLQGTLPKGWDSHSGPDPGSISAWGTSPQRARPYYRRRTRPDTARHEGVGGSRPNPGSDSSRPPVGHPRMRHLSSAGTSLKQNTRSDSPRPPVGHSRVGHLSPAGTSTKPRAPHAPRHLSREGVGGRRTATKGVTPFDPSRMHAPSCSSRPN